MLNLELNQTKYMKIFLFFMILFFSIYLYCIFMKYTFLNLNLISYFILNCLAIFGLIKLIDEIAKKLDNYD